MDNEIKEQLSLIFPQIDGYTIQNFVNEAKRSIIDGNLANILPLCIDLVLGSQSESNYQRATPVKQPNDDIIFIGSTTKVTSSSERKRYPVVYIDDERNEPTLNNFEDVVNDDPTDFFNHTHSVHGFDVDTNEMPQPGQASTNSTSTTLQFVTQMFPDVNCECVNMLVGEGKNLNDIVNHLLKNPEICRPVVAEQVESPSQPPKKQVDYFTHYSINVDYAYECQCLSLLKNDFRKLYVADIRAAMRKFNSHYAPTRKCLEESLLAMGHSDWDSDTNQPYLSSSKLIPGGCSIPNKIKNSSNIVVLTQLLGRRRNQVLLPTQLEEELEREVEFIKQQKTLAEEMKNKIYAQHLNEQQYQEEGQLIECGCCFGEFAFEEVVQCSEAHLFCRECLQSYAKEVIFGSAIGTAKLHCMTEGCTKPFPYSQLKKSLSEEEIAKYQDRLQEDCLIKVDLPNLVQCPFCEFKAIVPENEKVFTCLKPACCKVTCKDCQEEWKDHFGLKCSEVEKKSQTNLRLTYEERMTIAKVRKCSKCFCQFMKSEGCNKMTCRCCQTMCYVCRKSPIDYGHFCRHPRDPGHKCTQCTSCSLWSDPSEDDELAVKQLQQEAETAKRKLDEDLTSAKKQKVCIAEGV